MSYGDYVHLDVEFDAFQTGNEVAEIMSGTFNALGSGFVDVQYNAKDAPSYDISSLITTMAQPDLVGAINKAEYQAEQSVGPAGGQVTRQRHGGVTPGWRTTPRGGRTSGTGVATSGSTSSGVGSTTVTTGGGGRASGRGGARGGAAGVGTN